MLVAPLPMHREMPDPPAPPAPHALPHGPGSPPVEGVSTREARARLDRDGPNVLPQSARPRWWGVLWRVVREPMLLLLLGAALVYLLLGDPGDAIALCVSVLLVVALTLYQELRSERALQAMRELGSPRATVVRDGRVQVLAAAELVTGDLIHLAEGDRVPADARVLEESNLLLDESLMTGESAPVHRTAGGTGEDNLVCAGCLVVQGHGTARVVATGASTQMGRLGLALRDIRPLPTPMQRDMRRAAAVFSAVALAASALVVALYGSLRGDWLEALLAGITLAIANIPEELPVVLAVFLALGSWRMARHKALVRRPPAIEALGSVTVLCTDKTGTLTENRMRVAGLELPAWRMEGDGDAAQARRDLLDTADLACPDHLHDPMERAIRDAARENPARPGTQARTRLREYPLTPALLATVHVWQDPVARPGQMQVACKGAPETVAGLCSLPHEQRTAVLDAAAGMAERGLRVLGVARGHASGDASGLPASPQDFPFEWLGLIGFEDPLRDGVPEAVAEADAAGIRVVMLTGDHPATARAIALQAGLDSARVLSGAELEALGEADYTRAASSVNVFARIQPLQKLRLVRALVSEGSVVAMTGDGVNDAPALMAAHVGVAMGQRGTEVAREAAAIVLLDDNFVTVVRAIRLGRSIYDNIERAVRYILAVHIPITGLALLPLLLGEPLVLLPLHVVFVEMIIDPASTIVFEREPPAADVMRRPPRTPRDRLLNRHNLSVSIGLGLVALLAVVVVYLAGRGMEVAQSQLAALSFIALVSGNLALLVASRKRGARPAGAPGHPNLAFRIVAIGALAMLAVVVWIPGPAGWFGFASPPLALTAAALALPWVLLAPLAGRARVPR